MAKILVKLGNCFFLGVLWVILTKKWVPKLLFLIKCIQELYIHFDGLNIPLVEVFTHIFVWGWNILLVYVSTKCLWKCFAMTVCLGINIFKMCLLSIHWSLYLGCGIILFLCYNFEIKVLINMKQKKTKTYNHKFVKSLSFVLHGIMYDAKLGSSLMTYGGLGVSWKGQLKCTFLSDK